jgi:hypothetical protein
VTRAQFRAQQVRKVGEQMGSRRGLAWRLEGPLPPATRMGCHVYGPWELVTVEATSQRPVWPKNRNDSKIGELSRRAPQARTVALWVAFRYPSGDYGCARYDGAEGALMEWTRILAYITGTVDQELLLRNEYLAAENRILHEVSDQTVPDWRAPRRSDHSPMIDFPRPCR